jgi:hypothetical protein
MGTESQPYQQTSHVTYSNFKQSVGGNASTPENMYKCRLALLYRKGIADGKLQAQRLLLAIFKNLFAHACNYCPKTLDIHVQTSTGRSAAISNSWFNNGN